MQWNNHSSLVGQHAFLSASKYHWINYDDEKLIGSYTNYIATLRGTELHNFAAMCIRLKQKLPRTQATLNQYVNDAIGYRMRPEQILYYSPNCFGTCDSISFNNNLLRIHDLKTGVNQAHMNQLMVYASLFCLEYRMKPTDIDMELRIYQNNQILYLNPEADEIAHIMDKIVVFDKLINELKETEG